MSKIPRNGDHKITGMAFLSALALLTACSNSKDKAGETINDMRWPETVKLASGEAITVNRHIRFRQEGIFGGGMSAAVFEAASLDIVPTPADFMTWSAPIIPILIDRDPVNGEWIVIAASDGSALWEFNGKPCPPQWGFRLHDGIWYIQPIPSNLIGRKPNLLVDFQVTDDAKFSPEELVLESAARLLHQTNINEGREWNDRIPAGMVSVGFDFNHQRCGPNSRAPRFTDKFYPERAPSRPNLANFPRTR
jgi:hypothetical protein